MKEDKILLHPRLQKKNPDITKYLEINKIRWMGREHLFNLHVLTPVSRRQILDSSKLKDFADDNLKFEEKRLRVIQTGRKHCEKRRNCSLRAISPFPTVFSKGLFPMGVKRSHCVGMGQTVSRFFATVHLYF